jgi:NodT family efflux transporter outer membrane factor (OMF) lipoprotein
VSTKKVVLTRNQLQSTIWLNAVAVAVLACMTLAGCTVGPDFKRPDAPNAAGYTADPMTEKTASAPGAAGSEQRFVIGQEISDQWWTLFHCEALDQLIRRALAQSPTIAATEAALRQAQENWRAAAGTLFPAVDATASASRQKLSGAAFGQPGGIGPLNLYNASVNVSYALDIFGGTRRNLEALDAQIDYQRFQVEAAYLALTSNIVTAAVKEASLREQIQTTQEMLEVQEKGLYLVKRQFEIGSASRPDILAQETQLAQTRSTLPPLERQLAQVRHQLAALTGTFPAEAKGFPVFDLGGMQLPDELPVSLPSSLVEQRPDIRASEALLHAASARIGVATANLYPQITLTGSYGAESSKFLDIFKSGSSIWSIAGGLAQPVFHGGALTAQRRAAIAAYDQAAAQYQEIVLEAFQNVADVLVALDADARALKAQAGADAAAANTLQLTQKQYQFGAASYLQLLNAERQYRQTRLGLVQARAARFADTAALFQAMGGGWWKRGDNP